MAIDLTSHDYATGIAAALREDYDGGDMVKSIARDTGAALGTIKKWVAGDNGPGGEHLIKLMAVSPAVRAFVNRVTRIEDQAAAFNAKLRRALAVMEEPAGKVIDMVPTLEAELAVEPRRPPAPSRAKLMPPRALPNFREWKVSTR